MKYRATKILEDDGSIKTQLTIAGFTKDFSSDWHKQIKTSLLRKEDVLHPYERAMLGFLAEKYEPEGTCDFVLNITELDVMVRNLYSFHTSFYTSKLRRKLPY